MPAYNISIQYEKTDVGINLGVRMNFDFHENKLFYKASNTCHALNKICKYIFITKKETLSISAQNHGFL